MVDERPNAWRRTIRQRALIACGLLALWTAAIEGRLAWLQVVRHADLVARADRQQKRTIDAPAGRCEVIVIRRR